MKRFVVLATIIVWSYTIFMVATDAQQPAKQVPAKSVLAPVPSPVLAAEGGINLAPGKWTGVVSGTNKVSIVVGTSGVMVVTLLPGPSITITGGGGTAPTDPPPVGLTPFSKVVAASTADAIQRGGTLVTATAMSGVYSRVADAVMKGETTPENALASVADGVRIVITKAVDADKWAEFRQSLGDALDTLRQDGLLKTKEQYAGAFKEIVAGMNSSITP